MNPEDYRNKLTEKGLKVTPQRIAILEAIHNLQHPTAENITDFIRKNHPNISTATVYKVLDAFVSHGLIQRVNTEKDHMRYDAIMENHHHLYCSETERIEDYNDIELDKLINEYFEKKNIENFTIQNIKLQITGKFKN